MLWFLCYPIPAGSTPGSLAELSPAPFLGHLALGPVPIQVEKGPTVGLAIEDGNVAGGPLLGDTHPQGSGCTHPTASISNIVFLMFVFFVVWW